jgi:hypothetical protein
VSWCKWTNRLGHIFLSELWVHFPGCMLPLPILTGEDKKNMRLLYEEALESDS